MARRQAPGKRPAPGKRAAAGKMPATMSEMSPADLARVAAVLSQIECARRQEQAEVAVPFRSEMPVRAYVRAHRAPVSAASAVGAADLAVLAAHASGSPYALAVVGTFSAAAGARVAWKHRKKARRRPRARRWAAVAWTGSSAAALAGSAVGMASAPGQAVMLAGGLAVAAPYLWHARQRPPRPIEAGEAGPAGLDATDPRIEAFIARFCQAGPCKNAAIYAVRDIPDGFAFELIIADGSKATTKDVIALSDEIAGLYDIPGDQVSVEKTANRSAKRARISVLTTENAFDKEDRWDGVSTYDPAAGTIRIGRFSDSADTHWMLHKPGSGAAGGLLAGVIGAGKSGTALVISAEAGLARLCAACGPAGTCAACDPQRIVALWMGDPQMQPFGVWRGDGQRAFADQMAWGIPACVHMIIMAHAAMIDRAAHFGSMKWTDHLGRENYGKGSYDPSPEYPILYVFIDEFPKIADDPIWAGIVLPLVGDIAKEGRKVGVVLVLLTQIPDLTQLGDREIREMLKAFNVIAHRTDGLSSSMLGIKGNPTELPKITGIGYISGGDDRPRATFRTKHCNDYRKPGEPGPDIRELAERIAGDPVTLDGAVVSAITPLGWGGPHSILDGAQMAEAMAAVAADARLRKPRGLTIGDALRAVVAGTPPPAPEPAAAPRPGSAAAPPAPPEDAPAVSLPLLAAVLAQRGELDVYDVCELAECDAWTAEAALEALAADGLAVLAGPCRYRSLAGQPAPAPPAGDAEEPAVTAILERAMSLFLARMSGCYDAAAAPADMWAQASAAAIVPGPRERPGHVTAVRAWLGQAADAGDLRFRCIALATLCGHLDALLPRDVASMRADPASFVAAADGYLHLADSAGDRP